MAESSMAEYNDGYTAGFGVFVSEDHMLSSQAKNVLLLWRSLFLFDAQKINHSAIDRSL